MVVTKHNSFINTQQGLLKNEAANYIDVSFEKGKAD